MAKISRSKFKRNYGLKTTINANLLYPIMWQPIIPGDSVLLKTSVFARMATLISPIMDNAYLDFFYFFVPARLVWSNFQKFMGEQENPGDSTDYLIPEVNLGTVEEGTLADYFGLPIGKPNLKVNSMPFRAYNLIWNEWFRDENLQDSVHVEKGDSDNKDFYKLLPRCKSAGYFSSALPFLQKGPGVTIPLGGDAPVTLQPMTTSNAYLPQGNKTWTWDNSSSGTGSSPYMNGSGRTLTSLNVKDIPSLNGAVADLSQATQITIAALRESVQIQRWFERCARSGSRYVEILAGFFGVTSPDARLQRPEFLGSASVPIGINQVPQTSASDDVTAQGNLAAFGVAGSSNNVVRKSFVEHGYLIGLVNVRTDLTYQQGLDRMWTKRTKFDLFWPTFAHLSDQPIYNKEIYYQGNEQDDMVFGYQERYAEYRYSPSVLTGRFRSTSALPLDVWHLAEKFENLPALNADFIKQNAPISRVCAVEDEPQFLLDIFFDLQHVRPMPMFGVPGLMDHF